MWNSDVFHYGTIDDEISVSNDIENEDGEEHPLGHFKNERSREEPHDKFLREEARGRKGRILSNPPHFYFQDEVDLTSGDVHEIKITYNDEVVTKYVYNSDNEGYERFINGEPHIDELTGAQLTTDNIVIVYRGGGDIGFESDSSEGKMTYYTGGQSEQGVWRIKQDNLSFFNSSGRLDLKVLPGKTWIQIVDESINDIEFK